MPADRRGRLVLFLVVAVCVAPLALAWFLFNYTDVGRGGGEASHGHLIVPPRLLPDVELRDPSAPEGESRLHGKWTLIYVAAGECGKDCRAALEAMHHIRLATGRNTHRVQRLLVRYEAGAGQDSQAGLPPGQLVADGELIDGMAAGASFSLGPDDDPLHAGRIYLADPLGNLIMSYPPGTHPEGIIDDLKRLLRYSAMG